MNMTKDIIFDLGGVLLDIDLNYCMRRIKALGFNPQDWHNQQIECPPQQKAAVLGEGIVADGITHLYQTGDISTEQFLDTMKRHCAPGTTSQQVLDAWNTCCIDIPQHRLDKIAQLRQRGYRISLLSNTNEAHWQDIVARCFGGAETLSKYFDHLFLSQEMHMAKPNDDIYLKVLDTLKANPHECLFIDDSTPNLEAAAALGIRTFHAATAATHDGQVTAPPQTEWTEVIDTLL